MKRKGNLFEQIVSIDNLYNADERARRGKKRRYGVRLFDSHRDDNLLSLQRTLLDGTFKTSQYSIFTIHEPKEREIYRLPYYPDRIAQHAIMTVLEPVWVSIFIKNTYACIKNRGIHACLRDVKHALRHDVVGTTYCLKIDIRKFYHSINHDVLKNIIRRKIKDVRLLRLLDDIIDSVEHGVPIGNYLSQFFANLYLAYFDHYVKEVLQVKYYFRYADDIVILSNDKDFLHNVLRAMRDYLSKKLKLRIKKNYQVFNVDACGLDFVGYRFYHSHVLLRKSIKQRFCRRVAQLNRRGTSISAKYYQQQIAAWFGWCKYCDSRNLLNKLSKTFTYELQFDRDCA